MAEQFQKMTPSTQYGAFGGVSYPITTPSDASRVINPNAQPSVNYGAGVRHLPAPGDLKDIDVPNGRGGYTKITVPVTALPGVPGGPPAGEGKGSGTSSSGVPTSGGYAVTKAPPGYDEALKTGTDFERGVIADASRINQQRANYSNMLEELDHIETGPGADKQLEAAAWLQRWGGNPMTAGITKEQIVSGQAFKKLSQQVANETAGMLSGSNQSQNNAALAQPNFDLVTQANQQIIHKIQGNLDAISAKIGAWNAWKAKYGAASSAQFQQWWNDNVDIRHFQAQHMADEERASIIGSIKSPREKDEFHRKARLFDHTLSGPNGWTKAIDNSQIPPMPPWVEGNHQ
jgi:hypothetical protein